MSASRKQKEHYWSYTGPYRRVRDTNVLEGMLLGISFNGLVSEGEALLLLDWIILSSAWDQTPFPELRVGLKQLTENNNLDSRQLRNLLGLCQTYTSEGSRIDKVTSDMQRLHGILGGVAADGEIERIEVDALSEWLSDHESLQGMWPYDEIDSLVTACARDDEIARKQQRFMIALSREFVFGKAADVVVEEDWIELANSGVCSACPSITFPEKCFCFTGQSDRADRKELADLVSARGGQIEDTVTKRLHYLVIAAEGSGAWAFSCYGRKVESAMKMRKKGHRLVLVHENDFWDAIEDCQAM